MWWMKIFRFRVNKFYCNPNNIQHIHFLMRVPKYKDLKIIPKSFLKIPGIYCKTGSSASIDFSCLQASSKKIIFFLSHIIPTSSLILPILLRPVFCLAFKNPIKSPRKISKSRQVSKKRHKKNPNHIVRNLPRTYKWT